MTTTYSCNTCHRVIDAPPIKSDISLFGRCIITKNCRGILSQVETHPHILRGAAVEKSKYNDWMYTPQLFTFNQTMNQNVWRIKHQLNAVPNVIVYVNTPTGQKQVFQNEFVVEIVDNNYLNIRFNNGNIYSGTVQCLVRSNTMDIYTEPETVDYVKCSVSGYLTFCVHAHDIFTMLPYLELAGIPQKYFLIPNADQDTPEVSPWSDVRKVHIFGNNMNASTFKIIADDPNSIEKRPLSFNKSAVLSLVDEVPQIYMLISNQQYDHTSNYTQFYDKNYNQLIMINDLNNDNNYISHNELYVHPKIIKPVYPSILPI